MENQTQNPFETNQSRITNPIEQIAPDLGSTQELSSGDEFVAKVSAILKGAYGVSPIDASMSDPKAAAEEFKNNIIKPMNEEVDNLTQEIVRLDPSNTKENQVVVQEAEAQKEENNNLSPLAAVAIAKSKGDITVAPYEYSKLATASLAKAFGISDEDGADWTELGKDAASEYFVPDTTLNQLKLTGNFLETLGVNTKVDTIGQLRDYFKKLSPYDKLVFIDKFSKYLEGNKDTLNGIEALMLFHGVVSDTDSLSTFDKIVNAVDDTLTAASYIPILGGIAVGIAAVTTKAVKAGNFVEILKQAKESRELINTLAALDPKILSAANTSDEKVIKDAAAKLGVDYEDLRDAINFAATTVDSEKHRYEIINDYVKRVRAERNISEVVSKHPGISLREEELQQKIAKEKARIEKEEGDGAVVTSSKLETDDVGGTHLILTISKKDENGKVYQEEKKIPVTLSDITSSLDLEGMRGGFLTRAFSWFASPVAKTRAGSKAREELITDNRINLNHANIMEQYLNKSLQEIAGTLSGKSRERFKRAILKWTKIEDETPTLSKLMDEGLTEKESLAVLKYFNFNNMLYKIADKQLIAEAKATGYKHVSIGDSKEIGRVIEDADTAFSYFKNRRRKYGKNIAIEVNGDVKVLKIPDKVDFEEVVKKYYEQGYVLSRTKEIIDIGDGKAAHWVFVKKDKVEELPDSGLLKKVRNYTPLIVDNAIGVVLKERVRDIGGIKKVEHDIVGYVDDGTSLAKAIKHMHDKDGMKVYRFDDPTLDQAIIRDIVDGLFTGKFRSERKKFGKIYKIKYDFKEGKLKKEDPNYTDPIIAASNYIRILSKDVTFVPKVLEDQKRLLNTIAAYVHDFEPSLENFNKEAIEAALKKINHPKAEEIRQKLYDAYRQIAASSGVAYQNDIFKKMANVLNDIDTIGGKELPKVFHAMRNGLTNFLLNYPVASLAKGFVATMFLGMYNIRQFLMQASNIQHILAISPKHGILAMKDMGVLAMFDAIGSAAALRTKGLEGRFSIAKRLLDKASNMSKKDKDFYENMIAVWVRTGLRENILSNADFFDVKNYANMDAIRSALSSKTAALFEKTVLTKDGALANPNLWYSTVYDNMFIYKAGDMVNRRVAFATAYREAVEKFGVEKLLDQDSKEYKWLTDRMYNLMFNMDVTNKARFQDGAHSILFMFFQVVTKTTEMFAGKELTTAEKARLFSSQLALYGRKAVTGYQSSVSSGEADFIQEYADKLGVDRDTALVIYAYGFAGFFSKELTGQVIDLSQTSGLQAVASLIGDDNVVSELTKVLIGEETSGRPIVPLVTVGYRVADALGTTIRVARMKVEDKDIPLDIAVKTIATSFAGIPSSTRNLYLSLVLYNTGIQETFSGNKVNYFTKDEREVAAIAQAMGFPLASTEAVFQALSDERKRQKLIKDTANDLYTLVKRAGEGAIEANVVDAYINTLSTLPEDVKVEVIKKFGNKLRSDPTLIRILTGELRANVADLLRKQEAFNSQQGEGK